MRSFSKDEIEKKLIELGGEQVGTLIKSEEWTAEILKEREARIGKFILNAVILKIEIGEEYKKEFLEKFRIKFSRVG